MKPEKLFVFDPRVPFDVLTKWGTNFDHFEGAAVNEMKPRGILCLIIPYF